MTTEHQRHREVLRELLEHCRNFMRPSEAEAIAYLLAATEWQPIETAPVETELLVGRFFNDEFRICQSGKYFDEGMNNSNGYEPAHWYWCCDWDAGGVTDDEGPTHWMPLPENPTMTTEHQKHRDPCIGLETRNELQAAVKAWLAAKRDAEGTGL